MGAGVRANVRVVFAGEAAICLPQRLCFRVRPDAKDLVIRGKGLQGKRFPVSLLWPGEASYGAVLAWIPRLSHYYLKIFYDR
jgi:hypothetical protein